MMETEESSADIGLTETLYRVAEKINSKELLEFARRFLKVPDHKIDEIQHNHKDDIKEQKYKILTFWSSKYNDDEQAIEDIKKLLKKFQQNLASCGSSRNFSAVDGQNGTASTSRVYVERSNAVKQESLQTPISEKSTFSESTFSTQFHGQVNAKVLVSGHGSAVHFNESQSEGSSCVKSEKPAEYKYDFGLLYEEENDQLIADRIKTRLTDIGYEVCCFGDYVCPAGPAKAGRVVPFCSDCVAVLWIVTHASIGSDGYHAHHRDTAYHCSIESERKNFIVFLPAESLKDEQPTLPKSFDAFGELLEDGHFKTRVKVTYKRLINKRK